jgi:hypothetical protein
MELIEELKKLKEDLAKPTFTGMDGISLNEFRKGYNKGQEDASKKIKKLLKKYEEANL